ncbi:MAG: condensation domain-containing protein [Jatrophihabitans sp.]
MSTTSTAESPATDRTAPLTFGQMSVWRDIDSLPRDRWQEGNVFHTFALPEPVSRRQLCQALTRLDAKHESLRTVYEVADPQRPRQRLLPPRPVTDVEVAAGPDAAERGTALQNRPFDLTADRQIRALGIAEGEPSEDPDEPNLIRVALCVHHIACDGWSLGLLMLDLFAFLGLAGEELPPAPNSLLEVAEEQRSAPVWQAKLKATQRHFRLVYQAEVTSFRQRDPAVGVLQVALESHALLVAAQALADSAKVSVASVFTAAFLDAVSEQCEPGPIRIGLMTSNRFLDRWRNQVTTMNQLIPMVVQADPQADFADRLASTQVATMRAYRLGLFDVDQVTPHALGLSVAPGRLSSLCMINTANGAPPEYLAPEPAGQPPQLHWEPVFTAISAGCYLRVFLTTQESIRLRLRTGGLAREVTEAILLSSYQRVLEAVAR